MISGVASVLATLVFITIVTFFNASAFLAYYR